ncbi:MAG: S24/S26 family peptidase [Methanobacterium sp.]
MKAWIIIGAIIIIAAAASATFLMPHQSNLEVKTVNQTVEQPNTVNLTVKTDGSSTTVNAISVSGSAQVPSKMIVEMNSKAKTDVLSDKSTVNSLKSDLISIAKKYNFTATVTVNSQFGTDKLPFPATVSGSSMLPTLNDGQSVIAVKGAQYKVGDIVIARHPSYGLIIKRVASITNDKVYLKSDNREVEITNNEKTLPDGTVEIETTEKTPLDTWQPKKNVIAVVKVK